MSAVMSNEAQRRKMESIFRIPARKLTEGAKIPILTLGDSGEVFYELALEMIREIQRGNAEGRPTVLICPVGPVGQYPIFVRLVNRERISLRSCWFINMDEYLKDDGSWVDEEDPLSFRGFMNREVYSRIDPQLLMPKEQRIFPDPQDLTHIQEVIRQLGGVDACFGGIGIDGHLAFNEPIEGMTPEKYRQLHTRVLKIHPYTRATNAVGDLGGAIDAMPTMAVTIGIHEILGARKVRLGVFRDWHRSVLRQAAFGEVSAQFPATLLQTHPDAMIIANANAALPPF